MEKDPALRAALFALLGLAHAPIPVDANTAALLAECRRVGDSYAEMRVAIEEKRSWPTHDAMVEAVLSCLEAALDAYADKVCDIEQQVLRDFSITLAGIRVQVSEETRSLPELLDFLKSSLHPSSQIMRRLEPLLFSSSALSRRVFQSTYSECSNVLARAMSQWIYNGTLPRGSFFFVHVNHVIMVCTPPLWTPSASGPRSHSLIPDRVPTRLLALETARRVVELGEARKSLDPVPDDAWITVPIERSALKHFVDETYEAVQRLVIQKLRDGNASNQLHWLRSSLLLGNGEVFRRVVESGSLTQAKALKVTLNERTRGGSLHTLSTGFLVQGKGVSVSNSLISFTNRSGMAWANRKVVAERGFRITIESLCVVSRLSFIVTSLLDNEAEAQMIKVTLTPETVSVSFGGVMLDVSSMPKDANAWTIKAEPDDDGGEMVVRVFAQVQSGGISVVSEARLTDAAARWTDAHGRAWFGVQGNEAELAHFAVDAPADEASIFALDVTLQPPLSSLIAPDSLEDLNGAFHLLLNVTRTGEKLQGAWKSLAGRSSEVWAIHVSMSSVVNMVQQHLQHDVCEAGLFDMLAAVKDEACRDVGLALRGIIVSLVANSALANTVGRDAMSRVLSMCQSFSNDLIASRDLSAYRFVDFAEAVVGLLRVLDKMGKHKLVERLDFSEFWRRTKLVYVY